jgi:hypothetical protein
MTSVTLIHPQDSVTIPVHQAITKCSLFQKNPTLTVSSYRVQSPVSLSIFREFVSALEGKSVNVTAINFRELNRLSEEFGFTEFSAKLWNFFEASKEGQIGSRLTEVRNAFLRESFEFIVNGSVIESEVAEAAALFPRIREQLSIDGCARKFFVNDNGIESANIRSLELLLSGEMKSKEKCQGLLIGLLGNESFERLFLNYSEEMNLWELMKERRIDLESTDVSVLSLEALPNIASRPEHAHETESTDQAQSRVHRGYQSKKHD